jgi:hypothetical protein
MWKSQKRRFVSANALYQLVAKVCYIGGWNIVNYSNGSVSTHREKDTSKAHCQGRAAWIEMATGWRRPI